MAEHTYPEYLQLRKGETPPADPHEVGVRLYADTGGALRTIQSDGTDAAVGGGGSGFTPVSCVLASATVDVSAPAFYRFKPLGVYDDIWNFNSLPGLPDGLGMSVAIDGSDYVITVTEAGVFGWTWLVELRDGNDATFTGEMGDSFAVAKKQIGPVVGCQVEDANATYEFVTALAALPVGAQGNFFWKTSTAFTTSPYNINANLILTRLA